MTLVRRCLLAVLIVSALPLLAHAQNTATSDTQVGTLVYFEGSVDVKSPDGPWTSATIEQPLKSSHAIRTGPTASAEIKWENGTKSTIGPETTQKVGAFYQKVSSQSAQDSEGLVSKFVDLFQGQSSSSEEVGGVRRASVEVDAHSDPGELYWKTFEEVSFEEAQRHFQDGQYAKAVQKFHLFLQQNPDHPNAPKAQLGLGLSYLKLNNPEQAREALEAVRSKYPDDPLADRAQKVLEDL